MGGQVIDALAQKRKHVPYRDSKLTRLLCNCLGGNARTAMVITASPHSSNAAESVSSLRFGDRAASATNKAVVNICLDAKELQRQLTKAKSELLEYWTLCKQLQQENMGLRDISIMGGSVLP